MPTWDAEVYLRFSSERTQPSLDLVARIDLPEAERIIDVGCGPGNSTAVLRHRWPNARIVGMDNSEEMIAAASKSYPGEKWLLGDAATWTARRPYDIVFSNAALQWVPNHARLFPRLFEQVAPGGALAVQLPAHYVSPVHRVILQVADDPEWRELMETPGKALIKESPSFYYDLLQPLAKRLVIWETEYYHILDGPHAIIEWFRGTGLRPFLGALRDLDQKQRFEEMLLEGYSKSYPRQQDGRILFPFRRLFIVAYK
jgi:trans-aconitate 2-methyltransferase